MTVECKVFKGLPSNKKGWYWVWDSPNEVVRTGCWYCSDYSLACEKCKGGDINK